MPLSKVSSPTRTLASAWGPLARRFAVAALACCAGMAISGAARAADDGKPDLAAGKEIAAGVCVACHGEDGNSPVSAYPILAGQHREYLAKQLHDFKMPEEGQAKRESATMAGFAGMLSDEDIRNVTAYFASQTLKPSAARNRDQVTLGQKIYRGGIAEKGVPACAACHGPTGAGMPVRYPLLHGQYAEYTAAELTRFRQGERNNNEEMRHIASVMSDVEIEAVSDYIAGLR